jgi:hypothetical protein
MKRIASIIVILVLTVTVTFAQQGNKNDFSYSNKFSLLFGMIQPTVLRGFNVEMNYTAKRMIFDYSHGVSLDPPATSDFLTQKVVFHLPYSTGFGIGYRFTSSFDLRFEPKLHSWELYNEGEVQNDNTKLLDFTTTTLGLGAYYRYMPFKNSDNKLLQGITTSTSLRYWQNVNTTLENDEFIFSNKTTKTNETMAAPNIGIANTPFIFNIAIGYTFGGK